jgi:hypothetical protein
VHDNGDTPAPQVAGWYCHAHPVWPERGLNASDDKSAVGRNSSFGVKCGAACLRYSEILRSIPKALRTENPQVQDAILKHLLKNSGAAFGATLYCDLVHFGAT